MALIRDLAVQGAQMLLVLLLAPLLTGFVRKVKARLMRRQGPPLLQPYRDLLRLMRKEVVLADNASWLFRVIPYMIFAATWVAAALVPTFAAGLLFSWTADLIAIVALLGSARFFLALAGMDVGTSFGGIGSSREMMIASLAEPAMLMIVFTLALVAGSTQLSTVAALHGRSDVGLRVSLGLALIALIMVAIAENARIPVDNPATHLELTMVHEAMVLEYSGRHLAMIELAAALKLLLYLVADRLPVCALGHRDAGGEACKRSPSASCCLLRQARRRRLPAGGVRDRDRQDAGVPRAGLPRRCADAWPARHAAAVRVAEPLMHGLSFDVAHLLAGWLVLVSFMHALPGSALCAAQHLRLARARAGRCRWPGKPSSRTRRISTSRRHRAGVQGHLHSGGAAPDHRQRLGIHREIETVVGVGPTMLARHRAGRTLDGGDAAGDGRGDPLAREDLAFALSVVLLGLLMMVTRRNAVSQVVGFMSLENGLVLAATGAKGMPLVVEISVAFSVLIAFIVIGIFLFRIRERFDIGGPPGARSFPRRAAMSLPRPAHRRPAHSGRWRRRLLAALPGYRLTARLNVLATLADASSRLIAVLRRRPEPGSYLLVDDLNIVFIVLNTFVGFTTSVFSASYIGHELETGRLTPAILRFYHAMYQVLMFAMNLALVANNIGLMWVAIELATLTTVLMVGIYRTHEALEAAWKYFILGSVGIALALFGTILVYMAARPVIGEGLTRMVWTVLVQRAAQFDPALLNVAFVFLLLGYGTKVGLAPLHAWLPDAHAEGPTPISAVLSGLLLNVALYAVLRFKMLMAANPEAIAPGPLMVDHGADLAACSRLSCSIAGATSNACSPIRRSSTWASSCSRSAWAGRSPISPAFCT